MKTQPENRDKTIMFMGHPYVVEEEWRLGTIFIYYFVGCGVLLNIGVVIFLGLLWFFNYSR